MIVPKNTDLLSPLELHYLRWGVLNAYFKRRKMFYMIRSKKCS